MEGPAQTECVEIKTWHYDKDPSYGWKSFTGTEVICIEAGSLEIDIEFPGEERKVITLQGSCRDYVIIPPGQQKRVRVTQTPAYGICIRWPSGSGNQRKISS